MYTQCPKCLTFFKLSAIELTTARGSVCCGHCEHVFDALLTLREQLPFASHSHVEQPSLLTQVEVDFPPTTVNSSSTLLRKNDVDDAVLFAPAFARATPSYDNRYNRYWIGGALILLLTLLGQVAWAERTALVNDSRSRSVLEQMCSVVGCVLPLRHAVDQLELISRDIRPHPSVPGALIISATLRNTAEFVQAFPTVGISLSDLEENRVAMRRFQPNEYVSDHHSLTMGLAPGAAAALAFEVADPGKNAIAFEFKFE